MHDGLRLTVNKDVDLSRQPRGGGDRLDQRRVITGAVLGNQIGAPAAIDPVHLDGIRRGQADLVVRAGNFDECPTDCVGGQRFQRGGVAGIADSSPASKCQSAAGSGAYAPPGPIR